MDQLHQTGIAYTDNIIVVWVLDDDDGCRQMVSSDRWYRVDMTEQRTSPRYEERTLFPLTPAISAILLGDMIWSARGSSALGSFPSFLDFAYLPLPIPITCCGIFHSLPGYGLPMIRQHVATTPSSRPAIMPVTPMPGHWPSSKRLAHHAQRPKGRSIRSKCGSVVQAKQVHLSDRYKAHRNDSAHRQRRDCVRSHPCHPGRCLRW